MCVGDIIQLVPGGNEEWGLGMLVCRDGVLVAPDEPRFFPKSFTDDVLWSPADAVDIAAADHVADPAPPMISSAEDQAAVDAQHSSGAEEGRQYLMCVEDFEGVDESQLSIRQGTCTFCPF